MRFQGSQVSSLLFYLSFSVYGFPLTSQRSSYAEFEDIAYTSKFSEKLYRFCKLIRLHFLLYPPDFASILHFHYFGEGIRTIGDSDKQPLIRAANVVIDSFRSLVGASDLALNCLKSEAFKANKLSFVALYKEFACIYAKSGARCIMPMHEDEEKDYADHCIVYFQDLVRDCNDTDG